MKLLHLLLVSLLVASTLVAQTRNQPKCSIRLDVFYATGGQAPARLNVKLLKGMNGALFAVTTTNTSGTAEFSDLDPGQYQAVVSGEGIQTATSDVIEVNSWNVFQSQTIVVQKVPRNNDSSEPTIPLATLSMPPKAIKEYNQGNQEIANKNWEKAIERFNKAIAIYPSFTAAYNNLAACYGQLGRSNEQRTVLLKAISVDENCIPALLNLSMLDIKASNFSEARSFTERVLVAEPKNVEALSYLAHLNLVDGQYDLAIAVVKSAHALPHQNFAVIHFTAASAYEHKGQLNGAIAELQLFLQEAPQSPRAEMARKAIAGLQKDSH